MKLIIAGSRSLIVTPEEIQEAVMDLCELYPQLPEFVTEVVSGGAAGIDTCGEVYARRYRIPVKRFLPDYDKFPGSEASLERNKEMARYADALIAWPSERPWSGTKHMIDQVALANKLWIKRELEDPKPLGVMTGVNANGDRVELNLAEQEQLDRELMDIRPPTKIKPRNGGCSFGGPPLHIGDMQSQEVED